jgi:hypothetical protein
MECGRGTVASLLAGYASDLAELEAIRADLVASQERLAHLAAAMTVRQEMVAALSIAAPMSKVRMSHNRFP